MSSYYEGQRRFALGGKGWTAVLSTLTGLTYIKWHARSQNNNRSQEHHRLVDDRGNVVPFADQVNMVAKDEDIVLRIWRQLPTVPLPNLYVAAGLFTTIWAYRVGRTFNMLMIQRYSDIGYQLRRPDVLSHKVLALKYLAVPVAIIPLGALAVFTGVSLLNNEGAEDGTSGVSLMLRQQASGLREAFAKPYQETSFVLRDTMQPVADDLATTPLANFAVRSQAVGRPLSMRQPMPFDAVVPPGFRG